MGIGRRFFLVLAFLCAVMPVFAYDFSDSSADGRTVAMGNIGTSGMDSDISFFSNPAAIYYYKQRKKFLIQSFFNDSHNTENSYLIEKPDLYIKGQFVGKGVSVSFGVDSFADSFVKNPDGDRNYITLRNYDIAFSFAYGIKNFSVGTSVKGGSLSRKSDVKIRQDSAVWDFFKNSFVSDHVRVTNSEYVDIKLGLMYSYAGCSIGIKSDKFLAYEDDATDKLSFENALDTTGISFYYSQDRYLPRGRIRKWVLSTGIEMNRIFENENRTINFGCEMVYQLSRSYNISFRTGYFSKTEDFSEGVHTMGIGVRLNAFDLSTNVQIPVSCYKGNGGIYRIGFNFVYLI